MQMKRIIYYSKQRTVPWPLDQVSVENRLQHPHELFMSYQIRAERERKPRRSGGIAFDIQPPSFPPVIHLTLPPRLVQY